MQRRTVVLPHPEGPSRQPIAPGSSVKAQRRVRPDACRTHARVRERYGCGHARHSVIDARPACSKCGDAAIPPDRCHSLSAQIDAGGVDGVRGRCALAAPRWRLLLAACAALPLLAIVTRGLAPGTGATWTHLANTVLPGYVANTLALVRAGRAGRGGRRHRLGLAHRPPPLSRQRFPGMGVDAAAGHAVVCHGLCVHRFPAVRGPAAIGIARDVRLVAAGLLVSRRALAGRRGDHVRVRALSVCLPAGPNRVHRAPACAHRSRAHAGARSPAGILARRASAGASGHRRRHRAGADGDAGRLRNGAYFAVDTFTTGIYRAWFSLGDRAAAAQLATALLAS